MDPPITQNHVAVPARETQMTVEPVSSSRSPAASASPFHPQELKKVISTRQFILMALSSSIGAGLLLSTSQALGVGGPAPLFISFASVGFAVWITMCALGELSTTFPSVQGSFYDYSVKFISPSWGFAMGWNYVCNFIFVIPFEIIVMVMCARYWNPEVSAAMLVPIFLAALMFIYCFGARWYAEAENVFGVVKCIVVAMFVVAAIFIASRSVPSDPRPAENLGFNNWKNEAFKNGIPGFLYVFMAAGMAYGGTEMLGLTAAECKQPRRVMRLASKIVAGRIVFLYLLPVFMIGLVLRINLDSDNGERTTVSPFVQAVAEARIAVLPDLMNGIIIVAIFSMANASVFASSRSLHAISARSMGPRFCALVKWDRPVGALLTVFTVSLLAFVKASPQGDEIFVWLLALASASNYFTWISICLCQIRCRLAIRKQNLDEKEILANSYRAPLGIWGSMFAILTFLFGLSAQIAAAVRSPLLNKHPAIASMLGIIVVAVFWVGYMVWCRDWTFLVRLESIDFKSTNEEAGDGVVKNTNVGESDGHEGHEMRNVSV